MILSSISQLPCKIMAVLLHFFFLCAFAWMLVEGLHLYSMVIKVFSSEGSKHFYYYAIGWGEYNILQVQNAADHKKIWHMTLYSTVIHTPESPLKSAENALASTTHVNLSPN